MLHSLQSKGISWNRNLYLWLLRVGQCYYVNWTDNVREKASKPNPMIQKNIFFNYDEINDMARIVAKTI